jgi:hypothetical protein
MFDGKVAQEWFAKRLIEHLDISLTDFSLCGIDGGCWS